MTAHCLYQLISAPTSCQPTIAAQQAGPNATYYTGSCRGDFQNQLAFGKVHLNFFLLFSLKTKDFSSNFTRNYKIKKLARHSNQSWISSTRHRGTDFLRDKPHNNSRCWGSTRYRPNIFKRSNLFQRQHSYVGLPDPP